MADKQKPKIVIIGSSLYGNQGAAAMLMTSIQELSKPYPQAQFNLLSLYPTIDSQKNNFQNLGVTNAKPLYLGLVIIPLAIGWKFLPFARRLIVKNASVRALIEADVILDQGGITFVDGRGLFLIYNIASILPGLILGKKIVKCSQALGPFNHFTNRLTAKYFLPRMYHILARGDKTAEHLRTLGLSNFSVAADYSFLLEITANERANAERVYKDKGIKLDGKLIGISPSAVVNKKCQKLGIDYRLVLTELIDWLNTQGFGVIIIPHSLRRDGKKHNNDLPLAQDLYSRISNKKKVALVDADMTPGELRYIISKCDLFITSRFHAMVSSLATGVPPIVIGWSHKYQEVIDMFKIDSKAVAHDQLNLESLQKIVDEADTQADKIRQQLKNDLNRIQSSAGKNTAFIMKAINENI